MYLSNALSSRMFNSNATIRVTILTSEQAADLLRSGEWVSAIGHPVTAEVASEIVGIEIPANRVPITLQKGDRLLVFEVAIPREWLTSGEISDREVIASLPHRWVLVEVE